MIWTGFIYLKEKENKIRKTLHKTSIKKYNLFSYWQYLGKFELSTSTFKARILLKVRIKSDIKKSILFFFFPTDVPGDFILFIFLPLACRTEFLALFCVVFFKGWH